MFYKLFKDKKKDSIAKAFKSISKEEHLIDFSQTKDRNSEQESLQN
jgi:hypothetical protein